MLDNSQKKAIILCVLKVLERYSDAEHPLTQERIAELVKEDFLLDEAPVSAVIFALRRVKDLFNITLAIAKIKLLTQLASASLG